MEVAVNQPRAMVATPAASVAVATAPAEGPAVPEVIRYQDQTFTRGKLLGAVPSHWQNPFHFF